VDPTSVTFPSNMCAVVGPNGCGKSNIIDAVRWVMGESSAKNLRGESMADVIFNGTVNRQPVGQASIELVFDNHDGSVGGEYASYAEIAIKRQVSREGQSEYFLNGGKCRRRDITDIFLGTGLGPRSYAIIEQGMITRLIESKPEELRVFIEEAAGISKYKERRRETESRMRRTLENLERLTDLREELERQLQHLQRQAQAAEKYGEFKAEERELRAQLQALQWRSLDSESADRKVRIGELDVKLESVIAEHRQVESQIETLRVDHAEATDTFNDVQGRYYNLGAEVSRIEQTIKHQQERGQQLEADLGETERSFTQVKQHLAEDGAQQQNWEAEIAAVRPELETLQAREQNSHDGLVTAEKAMQGWQQDWDEFNQHAARPRQQAEVQQSRIQHLEQALQRIQQRIASLEEERAGLSAGPADEACERLAGQLAALDGDTAQRQARSEALLGQVNQVRQARSDNAAELDGVRGQLQEMRGRQASLDALQQAAMDTTEEVDGWLQDRSLAERPRLLEKLEVEQDWQLAVETVLGDCLQAVSIDSIDALTDSLAQPPAGVALLETAATQPPAAASQRVPLAAMVRGTGVADLLHGVFAVAELSDALQQRGGLAAGESLVTRDGVWVGSHWLRLARRGEESGGIIQRQQELQALTIDIAVAAQRRAGLEANQQRLDARLKQLDEERHAAESGLHEVAREHASVSAELSAERAKIEQIDKRRSAIDREVVESRDQFQHEQQALAEARQLLSAAIETMEQDSRRREELLSRRDETRTRLDEARQTARHDKDAAHQLAMRHQSLQAQLDSMVQSIERSTAQMQQLESRRTTLADSLASNEAPLAELQSGLEEQLEKRLAVEEELAEARRRVGEIDHSLRGAETERSAIEQRSQAVRGELEQQRLQNQTLQVKSETLQKQLQESGHVVADVLETMPEEAAEDEWGRRLERVGNRIARLGPINLAAVDEYSQQSERKNYLDAQNEDLETALETLQSAIRKIDKETRNRFQETFDQVNSGLQDLFPRVFGGGTACLEMTGDDLLDTGITIMARPPGKKNSTIHLLSGGEKALTAIALVFSIFRLNPAPFCMLDEVDAPLDDANVGRYARMVKEMSEHVQFIFITHNKITMELADQLMGVTMQEPGVSRLVTVDVDEAAQLAAV
jgi:chromosome segregation protein